MMTLPLTVTRFEINYEGHLDISVKPTVPLGIHTLTQTVRNTNGGQMDYSKNEH